MKRTTIFFLVGAALLLAACSSDVEELNPIEDARTLHTATLRLNGTIEHFDAPATRATTADWDDGATIYIQYQTSNGMVDGTAVYNQSKDEWTVNYYGNITQGQQTKCEVYYFEQPASTTQTAVSLNAQSAVFADSQASYLLDGGIVTLNAHFKPLTGRFRFKGTAGYQFSFNGLKWYSGYDISSNTLSQQAFMLTLTVGSDGYTPYVYGVFADASARQLSVDSGEEDYVLRKNFEEGVLVTGKSGYVNVPTLQSHNGWQLVDGWKQEITVTGNGKKVTFNMVRVKAGTFQMGSTSGWNDEKPVHSVTLTNDYLIGETEVTQALWYAVMGLSPTPLGSAWSSAYGLGDNNPAYYISYEDCQEFLTRLNQMTELQFRFPTEAEWEYAARGGIKSQGYTYAGSNNIGNVAWYKENSGSKTQEVATKDANELGLYDMSGNVEEWCADWYGSYNSSNSIDPKGPSSGTYRMYRGGYWNGTATDCRVACRSYNPPTTRSNYSGFRLAHQVPK